MLPRSRWALRLSRSSTVLNRWFTTIRPLALRSDLNKYPPAQRRPRNSNIPSNQPSDNSPSATSPESSPESSQTPEQNAAPSQQSISDALRDASQSGQNTLNTPVHIPSDPNGILKETHPAMSILGNSSLVMHRQLEMMNVMIGFEQANKYAILDAMGNHLGYLFEQELGMGNAMARQVLRTHRAFTAHVLDRSMKKVLRIHRPFSYINSRIRVYDALNQEAESSYQPAQSQEASSATQVIPHDLQPIISDIPLKDMRLIGESQQEWAPLRRKYNLFLRRSDEEEGDVVSGQPVETKALQVSEARREGSHLVQFARVDEPFLSWDFNLRAEDGQLVGAVNRSFGGFAREIFTDTGMYALRMDSAQSQNVEASPQDGALTTQARPDEQHNMTLDQRAVMLATAVSVDFDYFSRHSRTGGMGFFPLWMGGGGEAAGAGAGAGAAGAGAAGAEAAGVGAAGAAGAVGEAAGAAGAAGAGAIARGAAGAGTIATAEGLEGAVAGAGAAAGVGAMQGMRGRTQETDSDLDASPTSNPDQWPGAPGADEQSYSPPTQGDSQGDDWFGEDAGPQSPSPGAGQGDGGGEGGGGVWDMLSDFFGDE